MPRADASVREWAKDSLGFARETIIGRVGRAGKMVGASATPRHLDDPCPTSSRRSMPYKFNETRRHKIPKARYRVANWPEYDAALARRGSITVWLTEEAVEAWHAPGTGERGGQPVYSA